MNATKEWNITQQMINGAFAKDAIGDSYIRAKNRNHLQNLVREYRSKGYMILTYAPEFIELEHPQHPGIIVIETDAHAKRGGQVKDAKGDEIIRVPDRKTLRSQVDYFRSRGWQVNKDTPEYAVLRKPGESKLLIIRTVKYEMEVGDDDPHRYDPDKAKETSRIIKSDSEQFTQAKIDAENAGAAELLYTSANGHTYHLYYVAAHRWEGKPNSMSLKYGNRNGVFRAKFDPNK